MVSYRTRIGISYPKDEAAAQRIRSGKAREADWKDVAAGRSCTPPASVVPALLDAGYIEEVGGRG